LAEEHKNGNKEQQHISVAQSGVALCEIGLASPDAEQGGKHTAQKNKEV
jgi:hypothetical protein